MLIADVVASEWEFLRWSRLKFSLIQACAAKVLKEFLNSKLDYDLYRERFVQDLTEILQDNLPEDDAEDRPQRLARDCAMNETGAVNSVTRYSAALICPWAGSSTMRGTIGLKSSLRSTSVANLAPWR